MTAYRFCRTDDRALLIEAHEACRGPEHLGEPPLDLAEFKRLVRDLDLWCSSCMVAFEGRQPVGVLLGAKRADATLVYDLRVHPAHRRKGHGRHLLTSLSQKLAILGPPKLLTEVPASSGAARATFEACGWQPVGALRDWRRPAAEEAGTSGMGEALAEVALEDLAGLGLPRAGPRPWQRDLPSLSKLADRARGLAFHSPDQLEAWVLWLPAGEPGSPLQILALGAEPGPLGRLGLSAVIGELARRAGPAPLLVPRAAPEELAPALLTELGFLPGDEWLSFAREARPA